MNLASLPDASTEDGRLVVVSRDLTRASDVRHIAPTLAAALADWPEAARELDLVARGLEADAQPEERFHERTALAPLPAQCRPARGASVPAGTSITVGFHAVPDVAGTPRLLMLMAEAPEARLSVAAPAAVDATVLEEAGVLRLLIDGAASGEAPAALRDSGPVAIVTAPPGGTLRIEAQDAAGRPVFGAIELTGIAAG
ncbi:MAG: hypothetical protein QM699_18760 [Amaricoccus sp.]|uniref:hypothetical protein n=1 Tax=Amaricoccus sp. TaxID=1872485 RepID=UPI0039E30D82